MFTVDPVKCMHLARLSFCLSLIYSWVIYMHLVTPAEIKAAHSSGGDVYAANLMKVFAGIATRFRILILV